MAITTAFCTSAKTQALGVGLGLQTGGDSIKMALYTSSATLGATTTAYTPTNEIAGTGYTATGSALSGQVVTSSGTTAFADFTDETWATATFTARGCMIYNDTDVGDPSISIHDFGSDKTASGGNFLVQFPTADSTNAVIRLA